jgi:short-subunit dehydrogenase
MKSLKNKVIWITGASSGIGEALAYELSKHQAKLVLSSRNIEVLQKVAVHCKKNGAAQVAVLDIDLSKSDTLEAKTKQALDIFGSIDILINNAGISQRSLANETAVDIVHRIMEINFFGAVNLTTHILPSMLSQGSGHIVNISSLVGKFGTPFRSSYSASKHALHGYFDSLRAELFHKNIVVTMVCPGFIKTQVSVNALDKEGNKTMEMDEAQENGMLPEVAASKIVKAIKAEKEEILVGGKEIYAVYLKRFFPGVFSKIIRKVKVR